jgi:pyrrolidone-carboxylate peptidase
VTGFGPFRDVTFNPSGAVAESLQANPPAGWEVSSAVLPVKFEGAPKAIDEALASMDAPVTHLLGLGVHPGRLFRLERRARLMLEGGHVLAALETPVHVTDWAQALSVAGGGAVMVSNDAGRYVCERAYYHLLLRGWSMQIPGLFLHVPPDVAVHHESQARIVRAWLQAQAD